MGVNMDERIKEKEMLLIKEKEGKMRVWGVVE